MAKNTKELLVYFIKIILGASIFTWLFLNGQQGLAIFLISALAINALLRVESIYKDLFEKEDKNK